MTDKALREMVARLETADHGLYRTEMYCGVDLAALLCVLERLARADDEACRDRVHGLDARDSVFRAWAYSAVEDARLLLKEWGVDTPVDTDPPPE